MYTRETIKEETKAEEKTLGLFYAPCPSLHSESVDGEEFALSPEGQGVF